MQYRYFELKMRPWRKESIAEKNEKFCWTLEPVLCDNGKPRKTCTESNRSSNSCFNYENTTHYLSLYSRVRVGFARASSASGTSAAGNRWYESGCSGADESGSRSAAAACHEPGAGTATACDEPGAGAATTAARRTWRSRTTSSSRPTWSARRSDQSGSSWRNKSCCSRSGESCPSCCSHSGTACWFFGR